MLCLILEFYLSKFQDLAKDDIGTVKTGQSAMATDTSFGFCSVSTVFLVQSKCSFARFGLCLQLCTGRSVQICHMESILTGYILLSPTEKQDHTDI